MKLQENSKVQTLDLRHLDSSPRQHKPIKPIQEAPVETLEDSVGAPMSSSALRKHITSSAERVQQQPTVTARVLPAENFYDSALSQFGKRPIKQGPFHSFIQQVKSSLDTPEQLEVQSQLQPVRYSHSDSLGFRPVFKT